MEESIEAFLNLSQDLRAVARALHAKQVRNSIVFFGSARIPSPEDARSALDALRATGPVAPEVLARAEKALEMSQYYTAAEELSYQLSLWAKNGPRKEDALVICSGGGPSIMEAANKGAHRAQWHSLGISINKLKREQKSNPFLSPGLDLKIDTFILRKFWLLYFMKAVIVFPGGYGTLDEVFEVLNLMSTGKMNPHTPFVFFGSSYWNSILHIHRLVEYGTISAEEAQLFCFADSVEEAFSLVTQKLEQTLLP